MSKTFKTIMIGIGILAFVLVAVFVVYQVRKPTTLSTLPTPKPIVAPPIPSPVAPPVFEIDQAAACTKTFVVACASASPSSSVTPSLSPSPSPSTPASANLDCVAKRIYLDDSRNRAGFYYLEQPITDTNTLENGQTIVYNVSAKNTGGNSVSDTTLTDKLSSNLTYVDGDSGCTYESSTRTVTCTMGTLSANSEAARSFRTKVSVSGTTSVANTAEVSSTNGQRDSCSVSIDATGKVAAAASPAPTALPVAGVFEVTTGTLGIGLLLLILGGLGLLLI